MVMDLNTTIMQALKLKLFRYFLIFALFFVASVRVASMEDFSIINENFNWEEIPISFVSGGLPTVEVKVHNQTYRLLLDTGADSVTIAFVPSALERLNPTYLEAQKRSLDVYGNLYQERTFILSQMEIGNLKIANLIGSEELRGFVPCDGIIGNRFLKQFNVYIDYQNLKVRLYPQNTYPGELALDEWQKVSFEHNNIGIIVSGRLGRNKKEIKLCLDTGMCAFQNGRTYGLLRPQNMPGLFNKRKTYETKSFYMDGIDFGSMDFIAANFEQPPVDGFLGHNFFSRYKVFIDFNQEILYVKRNNN